MKGWNPFGRIDMEIGSFLEASPFNKDYAQEVSTRKKDENKTDANVINSSGKQKGDNNDVQT